MELSTTDDDSNINLFDWTSIILILKNVCSSKLTSSVSQYVYSVGFNILPTESVKEVKFVVNV